VMMISCQVLNLNYQHPVLQQSALAFWTLR
jgi:hypothetical protein